MLQTQEVKMFVVGCNKKSNNNEMKNRGPSYTDNQLQPASWAD